MEVFDCIVKRRSIRVYEKREVSDELLWKLVDAGRWAPSGSNIQPLHYIIVRTPEQIKKVKAFTPGMSAMVPAVIAVCTDLDLAARKGGKLGCEILAVLDAAMAAQNILLMATDLGLGTCVIRSFNPGAVQTVLNLPETIMPQLLVSVGYPARTPKPPRRKEMEAITSWEAYQGKGDCHVK